MLFITNEKHLTCISYNNNEKHGFYEYKFYLNLCIALLLFLTSKINLKDFFNNNLTIYQVEHKTLNLSSNWTLGIINIGLFMQIQVSILQVSQGS
jgi:hypothetical protein